MIEARPAEAARARRTRPFWFIAGVLFIAWTLAYVDRYIMTLLVPSMKQDLGLSDTEIGLLQGFAFSLFFAVAGLPIGWLTDKYNRRNIIAIGLAFWSLMTVLCGLSTSFGSLFLARIGVGVGEACLAPASMSLIADCVERARRGRATTILATGGAFGGISANLLGGLLLGWLGTTAIMVPLLGELANWQMVFILVGLPGLVAVPLVLMIPEPPRQETAEQTGTSGRIFLPYAMRRRRTFVPLYIAFAANFVAGVSVTIWSPIVLMRIHGLSPTEVGLIIAAILASVNPLAILSGGVISDRMILRRPEDGRVRLVVLLFPLIILSVLIMAVPNNLAFTVASIMGVQAFVNMLAATNYVTIQDIVPNEMRGQAVAVHLALANIVGLGGGSLFVGLVTDYVFGDEAMLRASLVIVALGATIVGLIFSAMALGPYRSTRAEISKDIVPSKEERG